MWEGAKGLFNVAPITPMNRGLKEAGDSPEHIRPTVAPITPMNRGLKAPGFSIRLEPLPGCTDHPDE
jgi:hypothetical protein